MLCTQIDGPVPGQVDFFAVSRHSDVDCYSEDERRLMQLFVPHLNAGIRQNQIASLRQKRLCGRPATGPMAVVDRFGAIRMTEPGFVDFFTRNGPAG